MLELVTKMPTAFGLMVPRAGSPTSGLAMVKPAISVARPVKLCRSGGRDGDVRRSPPATAGARMIVESGSPVLVVKTVRVGARRGGREQPHELLERHVLGVDARAGRPRRRPPWRPSSRRRWSGRGSPACPRVAVESVT